MEPILKAVIYILVDPFILLHLRDMLARQKYFF